MSENATLQGFVGHPDDMKDRVRLCRPIISYGAQADAIFAARCLDWTLDERHLKPIAEDEVGRIGTLLPDDGTAISPGKCVAVMGTEFAAAVEEVELSGVRTLSFRQVPEAGCKIAACRREEFETYVDTLVRRAMKVFDLCLCSQGHRQLSVLGRKALFLLQRAPLNRTTEIVVRQLAGARAEQRETGLYAQLLKYFALDLKEEEKTLKSRVEQYLARNTPRMLVYKLPEMPKRQRVLMPQTKQPLEKSSYFEGPHDGIERKLRKSKRGWPGDWNVPTRAASA